MRSPASANSVPEHFANADALSKSSTSTSTCLAY